ncbi:MAG: hypothetical protein KGJ34_01645 [Patescibacteria group bacterium]|nr:hypothetical protein [Patescibacteria group bacterium]
MTHDPIGKCIYCDSISDLTDEHIFAYGLGGDDVLPKASCKSCAKVTGSIEQHVLRGLWWLARAVLDFPSRHPKDMPTEFKIRGETKDGIRTEIILTEDERFGIASFPDYAPPGTLISRPYSPGILMTGNRMIAFGKSFEEIGKKYNLASITGSVTYKGTTFARMLAKIALGVAVARFGLDNFEEIYIRDCILNKKDDVGMWVGCDNWTAPPELLERETKTRHASIIGVDDGVVKVRIRLFSFSPYSPAYLVVVGRLRPGTSMERKGKAADAFSGMNK